MRDLPAEVTSEAPIRLVGGFRPVDQFQGITADGHPLGEREVMRCGDVVAALALDPKRRVVVLLRQFRMAAHLATGRGAMVEIVAGRVDRGETPAEAAARECEEEIGLTPRRLLPMFPFLCFPGACDEVMHLFLALVDAEHVPERTGQAKEAEVIHPFTVPLEEAMAAFGRGEIFGAPILMALAWLGMNRARIEEWAAE